jgi:hypothetical protein
MTASTVDARPTGWQYATRRVVTQARRYFASDSRRAFQTVLGVIWLLDGVLQFQPFMYSSGFIQTLTGTASGQPHWLASSIIWAAHIAQHDLALFNTLFALVQVAIGLGLLYRPTVKPAIVLSLAWSLVVWWFAEGCGMLFAGTGTPLTGAPGAVLLYAIIALLVWPTDRPGGLLGARGARITWAALWLAAAWMWLLPSNSSANAVATTIMSAPGAGWLHSLQTSVASAAHGHGLTIALVLAAVSAAIGIAVANNWRPAPFLVLAIVLNVAYWVIGQGFGGIFYTNSATDPNAGPLFVLLAVVLLTLTRHPIAADQPGPLDARSGSIRGAGRAVPQPAQSTT